MGKLKVPTVGYKINSGELLHKITSFRLLLEAFSWINFPTSEIHGIWWIFSSWG